MLVFLCSVSALTKGEQMIPVMNALDIQCSVYGNHEFGKMNIQQI